MNALSDVTATSPSSLRQHDTATTNKHTQGQGVERLAAETESPGVAESDAVASARQTVEAVGNVDPEQLQDLIQRLNERLERSDYLLSFRVDEDINRTIISVVDQETEEIIREIPSEETVALAKRIQEALDRGVEEVGVLVAEVV